MAYSINEAVEKMDVGEENFIMGGASIYRQFFHLADRLYITRVFTQPEADTYFPEIKESEWELTEKSETYTDPNNGLSFVFMNYVRRS